MKAAVRQDDPVETKSHFRASDRVFAMNGSWYFAAREGDQGPYGNEGEARQEASRFVATHSELAHFQESRGEWAEKREREAQMELELTLEPIERLVRGLTAVAN